VDVMGWCYVVILIKFCLDLFFCCSLILIIGRIRTELLIHLVASFAFLSKQCLLMVALPAMIHFIFICSALDYCV
jgi:hypothetical protein